MVDIIAMGWHGDRVVNRFVRVPLDGAGACARFAVERVVFADVVRRLRTNADQETQPPGVSVRRCRAEECNE